MALLIALLTFVTIVTLVMFFASKAGERGRLAAERLARFGAQRTHSAYRAEVEKSLVARLVRPMVRRVATFAGRFTPAAQREEIRRRLAQAGNPWGLSAMEFVAVKLLLMVGIPILIYLLGPGRPQVAGSPSRALLLVLTGAVLGAMLPETSLKQRIAVRQKLIAKELPDVLDLLTVSVEAGLGFDASMAKVVEKSEGPLAEEFRRVLQEMRMGKPRRDALRDLGTRTGVEDLIGFTVALVQADQLGVSIGNVLRVQSEEMRRRRRQRVEEAAMKAPIKMIFPLVIFVFPTLFIVLLGPAAIQVVTMFANGGF